MLSEKRVIHMTRMELRRKRESEAYEVWLNTDRRDYISLHRVIGFVAGTLFYAVVAAAVGVTMVYVAVTNLSRSLLIGFLLGAVIGYIVFMFFLSEVVLQLLQQEVCTSEEPGHCLEKGLGYAGAYL